MPELKSNMMLHCGANEVLLDEVANNPTPAGTDTFVPVPHIQLYEEATKSLRASGLTVVNEVHALHTKRETEGANYFGLMEVESERDDYNLIVALRNSHIQQYAASFVLGNRVFVCDNLAFSGEVKLSRKHTRHVARDLPQVMARAVAKLMQARVTQDERIFAYKAKELSLAEADHALMNMVRARVLAANKILPTANEFEKPSHDEHLGPNGEHTVWTLCNAVTEVYKGTSVFTLPQRGMAMHGVCDALVGLDTMESMKAAAAEDGIEIDGDFRAAA